MVHTSYHVTHQKHFALLIVFLMVAVNGFSPNVETVNLLNLVYLLTTHQPFLIFHI